MNQCAACLFRAFPHKVKGLLEARLSGKKRSGFINCCLLSIFHFFSTKRMRGLHAWKLTIIMSLFSVEKPLYNLPTCVKARSCWFPCWNLVRKRKTIGIYYCKSKKFIVSCATVQWWAVFIIIIFLLIFLECYWVDSMTLTLIMIDIQLRHHESNS